jgi:23S rRNA G2445 N2-methylase RlmL
MLGQLRTCEDIFALVGYRPGLEPARLTLDRIRTAIREMPALDWALDARVQLLPGSRAGRRLRFRVIARLAGDHEFTRAELKRAVETVMAERHDRAWRLGDEQADLELWVTLLGSELFIALRLSDEKRRHGGYRAAERPGSLRPPLAAAMAWLSKPRADDVVLDPFCGSGTILIERALLGRYRMLYGGDSDSDALTAARANVGPRYKPIELRNWNATALPIGDQSVCVIITNLPWGIRYGSHRSNRRLYPLVFAEFNRVLESAGRIVLLTGEMQLMRDLGNAGIIRPERILKVEILGAAAAIYIVRKSGLRGAQS